MTNSNGYIYFAFKTEDESIELDTFKQYLKIDPTRFEKRFENGKTPVYTAWEYRSPKIFNLDFDEELEKFIQKLKPHQESFQRLKETFPQISSVLQIVMHIGETVPALHLHTEAMKFLSNLDTPVDFDIHNLLE